MHSKGHVRTEGEGSHLQTKVRGLRRNQPCKYPNSRLPASRTVRKCLLLSLPVCSAPLRQPEQTDTNTEEVGLAYVFPVEDPSLVPALSSSA